MARGIHNRKRALQEQMQKLKRLIESGRFSEEKRIALEMQYCYLQRDLILISSYPTGRSKIHPKQER